MRGPVFSKQSRASLGRLTGALTSVRDRDAAALQETQRSITLLENEVARLHAAIEAARAELLADDLEGMAAFEAWRANRRRRLRLLAAQIQHFETIAEQRRETLLQSNGDVEAVKRLLGAKP